MYAYMRFHIGRGVNLVFFSAGPTGRPVAIALDTVGFVFLPLVCARSNPVPRKGPRSVLVLCGMAKT